MNMFTALGLALFGAFMLSSADSPEIAGVWSGEDWGTVVLNRANPGEYTGSYSESVAAKPGEIQLKWSQTEMRYNGSWREGEDQFGEVSLRLVGDEIRGALSTDPKSKANHARPKLGDVTWTRGAAKRVAAAAGPRPAPLDLTGFYLMTASQFERIRSHPWGVVPRGSQTFCNVPLAIGGMLCLWGEANAKSGQPYSSWATRARDEHEQSIRISIRHSSDKCDRYPNVLAKDTGVRQSLEQKRALTLRTRSSESRRTRTDDLRG